MFTRIGLFTVRRRRIVLFLSGAFVALSVVLGTQVFSNLNAGGYTDPSSESELAEIAVSEDFDFAQPNAVFLVDAHSADVDDPAVAADAEKVLSIVTADPNVDAAFSYWLLGSIPQLRSSDGSSGLILANISADTDTQILAAEERLEEAIAELDAQPDSAISVKAAGVVAANAAVWSQLACRC